MFDEYDDECRAAMMEGFLGEFEEMDHLDEPINVFQGYNEYGEERYIQFPRSIVAMRACRQPRDCFFYMPFVPNGRVYGGPHQDLDIPF